MLEQKKLIDATRQKAAGDARVEAVMMYGSFTQGDGDAFSDVEFYVFVRDDALAVLDTEKWIAEIHPIYTHFFNEFGTEVVIFKNMVRGEYHFHAASEMPMIQGFAGGGYFPDTDAMCLLDKTGALRAQLKYLKEPGPSMCTPDCAHAAAENMMNNLLFGAAVLKRGEIARSYELLWYVQRYYLQLVRIAENSTIHFLNAARWLEHEISAPQYEKYRQCTASMEKGDIVRAYAQALENLRDITTELKAQGLFEKDYRALFDNLEKYIREAG